MKRVQQKSMLLLYYDTRIGENPEHQVRNTVNNHVNQK